MYLSAACLVDELSCSRFQCTALDTTQRNLTGLPSVAVLREIIDKLNGKTHSTSSLCAAYKGKYSAAFVVVVLGFYSLGHTKISPIRKTVSV